MKRPAAAAGAGVIVATAGAFMAPDSVLQTEVFGPLSVLVEAGGRGADDGAGEYAAGAVDGDAACRRTIVPGVTRLLPLLSDKAGRVLFNGYPTGVEVADAMVHGGPWPSHHRRARRKSVMGTRRSNVFCGRFACRTPLPLLPPALQDANPLNLLRPRTTASGPGKRFPHVDGRASR